MAAPRQVTLRFAYPDDVESLNRLAVTDSAEPPPLPALLAEVDGEPWAAVSLADGSAVADPFRPTAPVVELLRARARQLVPRPARRWSAVTRLGSLGRRVATRTC